MRMAVEANVRVAQASRSTFGGALQIAYRAGTITGMLTDGLGCSVGQLSSLSMVRQRPMPCWAWLWRDAAGALYARGRWYLHQGRRRGR